MTEDGFILNYISIIESAPLQVYNSALLFSPKSECHSKPLSTGDWLGQNFIRGGRKLESCLTDARRPFRLGRHRGLFTRWKQAGVGARRQLPYGCGTLRQGKRSLCSTAIQARSTPCCLHP